MPAPESSRAASLMDYFQDLEDPRMERRKDDPLTGILFITICAAYGGAEGWRRIETFGQAKQDLAGSVSEVARRAAPGALG